MAMEQIKYIQIIALVWTSTRLEGNPMGCMESRDIMKSFSPYSSPSTYEWGNDGTGVFIYLSSQDPNSNSATLKIYKAGER